VTLNGIDLSQYQAATPPLAGLDFAIVKATEGDGYTDPRYHAHAADVRRAGKVLAAYHFGRSEASGAAQAAHFLSVVGSDTKLVALDIEGASAPSDAQAREFIAACRKAGKRTGVYHSLSGFPLGLGQDFNWVADWRGQGAPSIPWAFWQTTSSGAVAGYAGRLDLDLYSGDLASLHALAGISAPVTHALNIAASATVQIATVSASGCIAGWTQRKWGPRASSAPCRAPVVKKGCAHGEAPVAYVTRGAFAGRWVRVGDGVTVKES
jgi:lysozyme